MNDLITFTINVLLTIVVETLFFMCFGYRTKKFILICVITNFVTNISINLVLYFFFLDSPYYYLYLLLFELIVIVIEATTYMIFNKKDYKLIPLTVASNCLSFLIGYLLYLLIYRGYIY